VHPPSRLQLHAGPSSTAKWLGGCGIGCSVAALGVAGLILMLLMAGVGRSINSDGFDAVTLILDGLVGLMLAPMIVLMIVLLLRMLRSAAWMEHTTVVVRGAFTTRRCDLATAVELAIDSVAEHVSNGHGGSTPTGRRVPRLCMRDPSTGRWLRLSLVNPATKNLLEPPKLGALADAILAGPQRPDPHARHAWKIAQGLYSLADDPFANMF
jgi:hypothetical protein